MKQLIAYYSRADENYVSGSLKYIGKGNTEVLAETLKKLTGADLFKIEQKVPYSKSYNDCIEEAKHDQQSNARPELTDYLADISDYDVIYLGYPNYWGTVPMAVKTFLDRYDFTGKTIIPFCTHEGSGLGRSVQDIKSTVKTADVKNGFAIYGSRAKTAETELKKFLSELK